MRYSRGVVGLCEMPSVRFEDAPMIRRAKLCLDFVKRENLVEHRLGARVMVEEMLRWGLVRVVDTYRSRMGSTERRPELRWVEGLTKEEAIAAYRTLKQLRVDRRAEHRMDQCRESVRQIEQAARCISVSLGPAVQQMTAGMKAVADVLAQVKLPQLHINMDDMVE